MIKLEVFMNKYFFEFCSFVGKGIEEPYHRMEEIDKYTTYFTINRYSTQEISYRMLSMKNKIFEIKSMFEKMAM